MLQGRSAKILNLEDKNENRNDSAGDRTQNLWFRRPAPYPLGHGVSTCSLAPESTSLRNVKMSLTKQKGPYFCRASAKSLHHWFTSCVGPESSDDITEANILVWFVTRNIPIHHQVIVANQHICLLDCLVRFVASS